MVDRAVKNSAATSGIICRDYFLFTNINFVLGVLLLNAVLTVEESKPNSHQDKVGSFLIVTLYYMLYVIGHVIRVFTAYESFRSNVLTLLQTFEGNIERT